MTSIKLMHTHTHTRTSSSKTHVKGVPSFYEASLITLMKTCWCFTLANIQWDLVPLFTHIKQNEFYTPLTVQPGYRFTKGLAQNLNLRTNLKLEYTIKSLNNIQKNYIFQAWFLLYWTMSFNFLTCSMVLKLLRKEMIA